MSDLPEKHSSLGMQVAVTFYSPRISNDEESDFNPFSFSPITELWYSKKVTRLVLQCYKLQNQGNSSSSLSSTGQVM